MENSFDDYDFLKYYVICKGETPRRFFLITDYTILFSYYGYFR